MNLDLVAAPDAAGVPGPVWLFQVLLVFTFFLHLLFMNLTLGGTLLAWISHIRSGGRSDGPHGVLAGRMMGVNKFAISMAITTGVAPLLFIQLIYGQFFYSGTILLGWTWFGLVVLVTAAYYAAYLYKFRGAPSRGKGGGLWLAVSAVGFLAVSMIHVAVHILHIQPDKWERFSTSLWRVLADPTFWPRWIHFVLAAIGFSALVIAWWSARQAAKGIDREINTAITGSCRKWALWTAVLQMVDGFVLLLVLPREVLVGVMRGGMATLGPLTVSILLGVGLLVMLARPVDPVAGRGRLNGALAIILLSVAIMSVTRHQVRVLYLDPATGPYALDVVPQWGLFFLFVIILAAALATVAYMIKRVLGEPATGDEAA